jgi:hypothetical protein
MRLGTPGNLIQQLSRGLTAQPRARPQHLGRLEVAMRPATALVLLALVPIGIWVTGASPASQQAPSVSVAIYDENPSHIWNRLYAALRVREDSQGDRYGEDSLDPMLWQQSTHLLTQPSNGLALRVLDEFLHAHAETLLQDPLKRAMLQSDLWAVFDWSVEEYSEATGQSAGYSNEKRELQIRLADVLRRLALTPEQIKSLPDNYAQAVASGAFAAKYDPLQPQQPFLPKDLFDPRGPWVCITPSPDSIGYGGVAKVHFTNVSGRSVFLVFVRLPEGRKATLDYFQTLWSYPQPWVASLSQVAADQPQENPDLPSFPAGTQVALARQAMLFDNQGNLVVSHITQSVQIRVYREITTARARDFSAGPTGMARNSGQDFFEIRVSRPLLFSRKLGGLRATTRDEIEPPTLQMMGFDLIDAISRSPEQTNARFAPVMQMCLDCHSGGGISSFNSLDSLLKPTRLQEEPRDVNYGPSYWSNSNAVGWKENSYDWGLLNGYWKARR